MGKRKRSKSRRAKKRKAVRQAPAVRKEIEEPKIPAAVIDAGAGAAEGPPPVSPAAPLSRYFRPLDIGLAALALVLSVLLIRASMKKERYFNLAVVHKKNAQKLKGKILALKAGTVPRDTVRLTVEYPKNGHHQTSRHVTIMGSGADDMALSLFMNDSLRVSKRAGRGRFLFSNVRLAKGENRILIKGVDLSDRVFEKTLTVRVGPEEQAEAAFQEGTPIVPKRNINYLKAQTFVPNQYAASLNFTRGGRERKWVALTFDGGAHAQEASDILDTLKDRQVKATFFLTGYFIGKYPDLVRRMHGEGHILGNHTDSHPHLTTWEENGRQNTRPDVTQAFLSEELEKADERYRKLGIRAPKIWRAPYGEQNRQINQWGESAGYRQVGWTQGTTWRTNLDTNDWVVKPGDPGYFTSDEAIKKILSFGNGTGYGLNGGIVLMHAGTIRKTDKMFRHLGALIDSLKNRGYELVTVTEMMNGAGLNN